MREGERVTEREIGRQKRKDKNEYDAINKIITPTPKSGNVYSNAGLNREERSSPTALSMREGTPSLSLSSSKPLKS